VSQIKPQDGAGMTMRGNSRATVRYRCAPATIGKVYLSEDHEYQRACVINLSVKGAGLQLMRRLEVGEFLLITIKSNDGSRIYEITGHVAHCERLPQGDWYAGCELIVPLTPDDLDQLL
jgi:hypothetical protein